MDTHWSKLKIGAWADRVARASAMVGLLALTFGPLPFQPSGDVAQAGTLSWSGIRPPLFGGADTDDEPFTVLAQYAAAGTNSVAVAPNGSVYAGNTANTSLYKSDDGGMSWTAAATGCAAGVVNIVVSPKYNTDSTVLVHCTTTTPAIAMSNNGGVSFNAVTGFETSGLAPLVFAVAPNFSGVDGGLVAVGAAGAASAAVLQINRWSGTAWGGFFNINATAGPLDAGAALFDDGGDAVVGLAFSPKFSTDSTLIVWVLSAEASDLDEYRVSVGNTALTTGNVSPVPTAWAAAQVGAVELATTGATTSTLRIAFPSDTETGGTVYFMCWNIDNNGVVAATEDVYKRTGTTVTGALSAQTPASSGTAAISCGDVAVSGPLDSAMVYVIDDTASPAVTRSTNGGTSWKPEEPLDEDGGSIGIGVSRVAISSNHASDKLVYAAASGTLGGISKSSNQAGSWADSGLTNNDFNNAYTAMDTNGATMYVIACDVAVGANAVCTGAEAIFRTTVVAEGSAWTRVDRRANTRAVRMSPNYATDGTVYATVGATTSSQVLKSSDSGQLFKVTTSDPGDKAVTALRVVSGSTAFVGSTEGYVWRTNDGGATWTQSTTDMGRDIVDLEVSPMFATDNTLLAGVISTASSYEVYLSTDGGLTWTQQGTSAGAWNTGTAALPMIDVLFSPWYGATAATTAGDVITPWIFAATAGAADDGVRRFRVGGTANWASTSPTNGGCSGGDIGNIAAVQATGIGDGIHFYAVEDVADGDFCRTYYPTTVSATTNAQRWLVSDDDSDVDGGGGDAIFQRGSLRVIAGSNVVYALNNNVEAGIRTFTESDAFLAPPTLVSPLDSGTVPSCAGQNAQVIVLAWQGKDRVRDFDIQVATDTAFTSLLIDTTPGGIGAAGTVVTNPNFAIGPGVPVPPAGSPCILTDGGTYYWRVRAESVGTSAATHTVHEGPWAAARRFSVGTVGAPTSPGPSLPLDGAQLPGLSTSLSWNNPSGTTQVQVQVTPLNGDGPAINLIFGSAISSYGVPAPVFGTGPYVMLPGASYTWRMRTTNAVIAVSETDPSWGPFSTPRTFTTAAPNSGTIQLLAPINGASTTDTTPTLQWKDANAAMFYYEVQLSADPNFGEAGAVAAVQWQLLHGGQSTPANSYTVPDSAALAKGTYYWRARHRLQATAKGSAETGVAFTPAQMFVVN